MGVFCPKRRADVSVRVVEHETVVFDRKGGLIHQFNATAGYIWDRCDGKSTVQDITSSLSETFGVGPETAGKDGAAIVSQLQQLNLLEANPRRNT